MKFWLRLWGIVLLMLTLASCRTAAAPTPALLPTRTPVPSPSPIVLTPSVFGLPTATPEPVTCAPLINICWTEAEQGMVAHICYDEARGLGAVGMASCAAAIAQRHARPAVWGEEHLEALLTPDQFDVPAARERPWRLGLRAPTEAREAVTLFLTSEVGVGCWRFDSFQASTPLQAAAWERRAPERHCVVIIGEQAMLFFNWHDG